jgi:hypothetical protein
LNLETEGGVQHGWSKAAGLEAIRRSTVSIRYIWSKLNCLKPSLDVA